MILTPSQALNLFLFTSMQSNYLPIYSRKICNISCLLCRHVKDFFFWNHWRQLYYFYLKWNCQHVEPGWLITKLTLVHKLRITAFLHLCNALNMWFYYYQCSEYSYLQFLYPLIQLLPIHLIQFLYLAVSFTWYVYKWEKSFCNYEIK